MNKRHRARLVAAAEPLLRPSERVEATAQAKIGRTPVKKNAAALAASVTVGVALGGVGVVFTQREMYLLLTDQRLMFFKSNGVYGPGRQLAALPRESLSATVLKDGLFVKVRLDVAGAAPIRLTFPPIPPSIRVSGRALAAALTPAPAPRSASYAR